jgi:trk system potassium uptake protein
MAVAWGRMISHPTRLVPLAFLVAIAVGTLLLALPISRAGPGGAPLLVALFTATSAVCVTGLAVVDTGAYWSGFGQATILLLVQVGGLGIMTAATLLGLIVSNRLRLGQRLLAQAETRTMALGDVRAALRLIVIAVVAVEASIAALLFARFTLGYGMAPGEALWHGVFHAVSAFNNAGFGLRPDNLVFYQSDLLTLGPLMIAILIGGIGFPVLYELKREPLTPRSWSLHTKLTLTGFAMLLVAGMVLTLAFEWGNARTIGEMDPLTKLLNALFHSVSSRTAGFNAVDIGGMRPETLLVTDALMLIGGGSGGTAGGIKVTTFLVLGLIVWAELLGERDANLYRRRLSSDIQRLAVSVALLAIAAVGIGTLALLSLSSFELGPVLFEAVSAFATTGLSTGITAQLPPGGQLVLVILMFVGRVGTVTAAAALVLRTRPRPYRYPEERPIIG